MGTYYVAKWTDERGENKVAGTTTEKPRQLVSVGGRGVVDIPADADVYRPARPNMVRVGTAAEVLV